MNTLKSIFLVFCVVFSAQLRAQTEAEDTPLAAVADSVEAEPVVRPDVFGAAPKSNRKVLVIGIANYKHVRPLKGPVQDARLLADFWRSTHSNVYGYENLSRQSLMNAIRNFGKKLDVHSEAIVYFSGHGAQYKGDNYLVPVDADVDQPSDLPRQGVPLNFVMAVLKQSRCKLRVVILDACRNELVSGKPKMLENGLKSMDSDPSFIDSEQNPVSSNTKKLLHNIEKPEIKNKNKHPATKEMVQKTMDIQTQDKKATTSGTLIAYATAPGKSAIDALRGKFSVFTDALHKELKLNPCTDLEICLRNVRTKVKQDTKNYQIPWAASSLEGSELYLNQCKR